mgnify:CR=1 FL=1
MVTGYKLTNKADQTRGPLQWGADVTHRAVGPGKAFCSPDLIHFYSSALVAVLHDPMHGNYGPEAHLWEIEAEEPVYDDLGLKMGAKTVTTLRRVDLPVVSVLCRVHYGILCAKEVYHDAEWLRWADDWLSGKNRDNAAARAAAAAARAAADAAAAARAAAYAAAAYAYAARAAAYAAAAYAYAATAAAYAAAAYAYAATAAARAAAAYGYAGGIPIDFPALALRAWQAECPNLATSPQAR